MMVKPMQKYMQTSYMYTRPLYTYEEENQTRWQCSADDFCGFLKTTRVFKTEL